MPLSGGAADKFGNRFEGRWTVRTMLRLLHEEARSIRLEPVGASGKGVEFYLDLPSGVREFHQVKRQHSGGGPWSIAQLASEGVLTNFEEKLRSPEAHCVFISISSADQLRELSERARSAQDLREFESEFLHASKEATSWFASLREKWDNCDASDAFDYLRRIRAEAVSEDYLANDVEYRAATLIDGNPSSAMDVLAQFALDNVHQQVNSVAIWAELDRKGFRRRVWNNDPHVLQAVEEANARYLEPIRQRAILGSGIPRDETQFAFDKVNRVNGRRAVLISGDAGTGKTGVVAEVVERAISEGWPVLALRMDRLDPVGTARQVGRQMDLPDSPVTVLAGIASGRRCLLLIDQLDAVSTASGRNPAFFERVDEMIRQAAIHPNMRLILSCRHFDLTHDDRLRRLVGEHGVAEEVKVGLLPETTVRDIVAACGLPPERLSEKQVRLLAVPLHLKVLTEVLAGREGELGSLPFETLKDLYDAYLEQKRHAVRERLGRAARWADILDVVLDRMMQVQSLSVHASVLQDSYEEDVQALLTEGVFFLEGNRLSFFHETFFDYAFAHRFIARGNRLLPFLTSREQHLFLRATVRQILTHERSDNVAHYSEDLSGILSASEVRYHLKRLVFQWLRSLPQPTLAEWDIVRSLMASSDETLSSQAWGTVLSASWFRLLDQTGFTVAELDSEDTTRVERMVNYVAWNAREVPERVAELALSFVHRPDPWPHYAEVILDRGDVDNCAQWITCYKALVERGTVPAHANPFGGNGHTLYFHDLADKQAEWGVEVFEAWLVRFILDAERRGRLNPFDDSVPECNGNDLMKLARSAPAAFTGSLLPIMLELIRRNALREGPPPWRDRIWRYGQEYNAYHGLHEQILSALCEALSLFAQNEPATFAAHADYISQFAEFETAGFLLARAYTGNGARFAEEAAAFLLSNREWLELGWSDSSCWATRQLLEAITPHCSPDMLEKLEEYILTHYSNWKYRYRGSLGSAQLALLNGIAPERRSLKVKRRLGELQRKFGTLDDEPPVGMRGGTVGPPFDARWEHMKNKDWLNAIDRYATERGSDSFRRRDFLKGGASELSSQLKEQAKNDPRRFARFIHRIPDTGNSDYFEAILWGLSEAEKIEAGVIWEAVRRCHRLPGRPCGRFIDNVIRAYSEEDIPPDILDIVGWYATEHPDPSPDHADARDPEFSGLNSVRGGMMHALSSVLFAHPNLLSDFAPYIERIVADESIAVRSQAGYVLLPVLNADRAAAVDYFLRLCDTNDERLLACRSIREFLFYACQTHFQELLPIIKRMLVSPHDQAVQWGAQIASLAVLFQEEARSLADECLQGSEKMRIGAAEVAAANLVHAPDRRRCEGILVQLFDDDSPKVRKAAVDCFQKLKEGEILGEFVPLVEAFTWSRAFADEAFWFFQALEGTTAHIPDAVCDVFDKSVELIGSMPRGERIRSGHYIHRSTDIVLRLYERTPSPDVKRRCLDIIDALLQHDVYGLEKSLGEREL